MFFLKYMTGCQWIASHTHEQLTCLPGPSPATPYLSRQERDGWWL